jgi:site-specific DNA-methyltransferase (adenine-specific)
MGKKWDYDVPSVDVWRECYRVLKPGGYLLAFAGTRTQHRMAVNIEDAGFEIRDMIAWVYGSGFPKSHNVSVSIDKLHGHGNRGKAIPTASSYQSSDVDQENKLTSNPVPPYEAKSDDAKKWEGWGSALKPAMEMITVARKPLIGTIAKNVLEYGTGGMNIDACRVPMDAADYEQLSKGVDQIRQRGGVMDNSWKNSSDLSGANPANPLGRWPANFIHDGSQDVLDLFPGASKTSDSAARFFYCSKAGKKDRDLDEHGNIHPTVKPVDLMRYLCRLVTQPRGTVLDPFMGSGTTGKAAMLDGFDFIGCEMDEQYYKIAEARIRHALER